MTSTQSNFRVHETPKETVDRFWEQALTHKKPLKNFVDSLCWCDWNEQDFRWYKKFVKLATKKIQESFEK
jgi:hypothetical protein